MTIAEAIRTATRTLTDASVPEPARESSLLVEFVAGKSRTFVVAHPEYEFDSSEIQRLAEAVRRRAAHEPFQYIVGKQEFYGLDFAVTPDVLIPRPETEMLVEKSIDLLRGLPAAGFLEIGIGSGCIAVSILKNLPNVSAVGVDISDAAIEVAAANAAAHGVNDRLKLAIGDVYERLAAGKFDLIVSNPPYVPFRDLEGLQPEVREHEPHIALSDGGDGLSIVKKIIGGAPVFLKQGGWLLIEVGFSQAAEVREIVDSKIWQGLDILPDLQGIPRMVSAHLR